LIDIELKGVVLRFNTAPSLFSPGRVDRGTLAMLTFADFQTSDKVLDLGCGYGVAGILAAKLIGAERVTMSDIDGEAVDISRQNAVMNGVPDVRIVKSNGFENIDDAGFTVILSNPPYHADFSVPKLFIEKGFNRLAVGGRILMVTKRREWYKQKFISVFGGVKIHEADGYFVFEAIKKSNTFANK